MNNSHYPRRDTTRRFKKKELTDYAPALALTRIRFYIDVLEAHFAQLGLVLGRKREDEHEAAKEEGAKSEDC
jgi:hypothetical protein